MISTPIKNKVLEEVTYFEVFVDLESGNFVDEVKNGNELVYLYHVNDEPVYRTKEQIIKVVFNETTKRNITKYIQYLIGIRGIKELDQIDEKDPEVLTIIRNIRNKRASSEGSKAKTTNADKISAINLVRKKYEPQYQLASFQIIVWSIVRDDLFKVVKLNGNKALDCKIEIEVPEDYWSVSTNDTDLDDFFMDNAPSPVIKNRSDQLEVSIAIVTAMLEKFEDFSRTIAELVAVVFSNLATTGENYDDEETFRAELVGILPKFLADKNPNINGQKPD